MSHQTIVKKPILAGTTPLITFPILDEDGVGFQPDTFTMSVYDVAYTSLHTGVRTTWPPFGATPLTDTIVNGRNDVDVISAVDVNGNVELYLSADDTAVTVPVGDTPKLAYRRILFTWTWDSDKVGKHEIILTIQPDRETVAT